MLRQRVRAFVDLRGPAGRAHPEAMACDCRVISTDYPGKSREVLRTGALGPAPMRHGVERFTAQAAVDEYLQVLSVGTA